MYNNMRLKTLLTVTFLLVIFGVNAKSITEKADSIVSATIKAIDPDSLLTEIENPAKILAKEPIPTPIQKTQPQRRTRTRFKMLNSDMEKHAFDSLIAVNRAALKDTLKWFRQPKDLAPVQIDSLILQSNPFYIDLVYENPPLNFNWNLNSDFRTLYYGSKPSSLTFNTYEPIKTTTPEQFIYALRNEMRRNISRTSADLYAFTFDQLPDPEGNKNHLIHAKKIEKIHFVDDNNEQEYTKQRIIVKKPQLGPWQHSATALAQFSQNSVSSNWYQGGTNNLSVLGILSGKLSYDDKKSIQWENSAEWKVGFNTVAGDSLRMLSTNDDVIKINSKLGIKAGGNWFYSGSVDFSTQLFSSYKGINSTVKKTSFLTPVRLNIGVGLDYKYKKIFSLMLSPVSFKYIYLDDNLVDPKLFGIQTGKHELTEIGSSFKATYSYAPVREIQLDSKFSFYTNYQKVEIDWEMVCNFTINRFMSTRISFNPRYDNTVIEKAGERAKIQYKQLLSVGFSHKFK